MENINAKKENENEKDKNHWKPKFCSCCHYSRSKCNSTFCSSVELLLKLAVVLYIITPTTSFNKNSKISVIFSPHWFLAFHHQNGHDLFCTSIPMPIEFHHTIIKSEICFDSSNFVLYSLQVKMKFSIESSFWQPMFFKNPINYAHHIFRQIIHQQLSGSFPPFSDNSLHTKSSKKVPSNTFGFQTAILFSLRRMQNNIKQKFHNNPLSLRLSQLLIIHKFFFQIFRYYLPHIITNFIFKQVFWNTVTDKWLPFVNQIKSRRVTNKWSVFKFRDVCLSIIVGSKSCLNNRTLIQWNLPPRTPIKLFCEHFSIQFSYLKIR